MVDSLPPLVELEAMPCPLCGSHRFRVHLQNRDVLYHVAGEFQIVRCLDCRHLYMNPRPTSSTILNCYPSDYGPHDVGCSAPAESADQSARQPWYLSPIVRWIPGLRGLYYWLTKTYGDFIPLASGARLEALELGCATGNFLEKLRAAGWHAQGVEPVRQAANEALRRGFPVHVGMLESARLRDDSFDAAFAWMVIEHLATPRETLLELARITRPDGWLVFSVPNAGCWEPYVFGKCWMVWELPRHLQHFTPKRLRLLLAECGYDRISIIHQRNLLNVVGSVGILLTRWFPKSRFAQRILAWPNHPTLWWQLVLAPFAIMLAWLHQGGRLTVVARRRSAEVRSS